MPESEAQPTTLSGRVHAALGFGLLFDALRDAVIVADAEGRIVLWNPAAIAMFGYTIEEARGMNVDALVPQRLRAAHHAGIRRYGQTGHGPLVDGGTPVELPALRKDGKEIRIELSLGSLEHDGRRLSLALVRDVTDRARLREELEQRNKVLADANDSLEAFSYVVSHDLKEPIRALDAYTRALGEDYGHLLPDEAQRVLTRAQAAAGTLARLVQGLLEFSRASQVAPYDLQPIRVREVIDSIECRSRFEALAQERGARIIVEDGPLVLATAPTFCQIFGNLILNAIKHNDAEAPLVHVRFNDVEGDASWAEITVEDNGDGFPQSVMDRFESLRAGRPASLRAGFGLLITRRAVDRLGGELHLGRSQTHGGAKATVRLHTA